MTTNVPTKTDYSSTMRPSCCVSPAMIYPHCWGRGVVALKMTCWSGEGHVPHSLTTNFRVHFCQMARVPQRVGYTLNAFTEAVRYIIYIYIYYDKMFVFTHSSRRSATRIFPEIFSLSEYYEIWTDIVTLQLFAQSLNQLRHRVLPTWNTLPKWKDRLMCHQ